MNLIISQIFVSFYKVYSFIRSSFTKFIFSISISSFIYTLPTAVKSNAFSELVAGNESLYAKLLFSLIVLFYPYSGARAKIVSKEKYSTKYNKINIIKYNKIQVGYYFHGYLGALLKLLVKKNTAQKQ